MRRSKWLVSLPTVEARVTDSGEAEVYLHGKWSAVNDIADIILFAAHNEKLRLTRNLGS